MKTLTAFFCYTPTSHYSKFYYENNVEKMKEQFIKDLNRNHREQPTFAYLFDNDGTIIEKFLKK